MGVKLSIEHREALTQHAHSSKKEKKNKVLPKKKKGAARVISQPSNFQVLPSSNFQHTIHLGVNDVGMCMNQTLLGSRSSTLSEADKFRELLKGIKLDELNMDSLAVELESEKRHSDAETCSLELPSSVEALNLVTAALESIANTERNQESPQRRVPYKKGQLPEIPK